ncbi:MAG: PKD domain-containing protein [Kineosporiaceae bacterium]
MTTADFRRLPIPPGEMTLEPGNGPVLVNYPMNAYVKAGPVPLSTVVGGTRVDVLATPIRYEWSFGDGGTLSTTDPGGPYPRMTTSHTYQATGWFSVSLRTVYTGQYRVAGQAGGGDWLPIDGTAEVAGPAVTREVIETRAVLVP